MHYNSKKNKTLQTKNRNKDTTKNEKPMGTGNSKVVNGYMVKQKRGKSNG